MQSFERLEYNDKASIVIVDNDSTVESKNALEEIIEKSKININLIISTKNLYYWGAVNYALNDVDFDMNNSPEWIIVCNNDILFNKGDLLSKILNFNTKDYPILAPAILSSKTNRNLNPFMLKPINSLAKVYYSIFFMNSILGYIIYKTRQLIKRFLSILNKKK